MAVHDSKEKHDINDVRKIIETLLSEGGCPWDKEQTHESLRQGLLEECYEVIDAINKKDMPGLCEELGDLLFSILFQVKLAETEKAFDMTDVTDGIARKMMFRHPHVFGADADKKETANDVLSNWDTLKEKEKGAKPLGDSLALIPRALPSLMRAEKMIKKLRKSGVKSNTLQESISAIYSNLSSISANNDAVNEQIGEILHELVNISVVFEINSEFALTNHIETIINRLGRFENIIKEETQ